MKSPTPVSGDRLLQNPQDFSLVLGGPFEAGCLASWGM